MKLTLEWASSKSRINTPALCEVALNERPLLLGYPAKALKTQKRRRILQMAIPFPLAFSKDGESDYDDDHCHDSGRTKATKAAKALGVEEPFSVKVQLLLKDFETPEKQNRFCPKLENGKWFLSRRSFLSSSADHSSLEICQNFVPLEAPTFLVQKSTHKCGTEVPFMLHTNPVAPARFSTFSYL